MDRCSSHGNTVDSCSCGLFHTHQANSFSRLFSMPNNKPTDDMYAYPITTSSSSVDCTLSLGTPSTRQIDEKYTSHRQQSSSCMSNFCCDIFQTKQSPSSTLTHKTSQGGSSSSNSGSILNNLTGDPLLARRCANCDTTSTPLWRNGPRGPKSLCNACGIRYKKEERRATTTTTISSTNIAAASWVHHSQTQKVSSISPSISNELRLIEDDDRDPNSSIPFLSCGLNVQDRPSLVHDFT